MTENDNVARISITLYQELKMATTHLPLTELEVFVRGADSGSLSEAGRALGLAPAAASAALKRLETRLGARLMVRSTRSLRLTPEGERYYAYCRQALDALAEGARAVQVQREELHGALHVAAPSDIGRNAMRGWLDEFQTLHPRLAITLVLSDDVADIFREPIDVALRYGELKNSSLVARRLLDQSAVLCASPSYIAKHGAPQRPEDLAKHNCLCFHVEGLPHRVWRFRRGEEFVEMTVSGDRNANDGEVVRLWTLDGRGLSYKSRIDIAGDLAAGRLIALLEDWQTVPVPLNLVYPHRRHLSPNVRALSEFLESKVRRS
jgi:DNA-binding transcriptional LysR family regulator